MFSNSYIFVAALATCMASTSLLHAMEITATRDNGQTELKNAKLDADNKITGLMAEDTLIKQKQTNLKKDIDDLAQEQATLQQHIDNINACGSIGYLYNKTDNNCVLKTYKETTQTKSFPGASVASGASNQYSPLVTINVKSGMPANATGRVVVQAPAMMGTYYLTQEVLLDLDYDASGFNAFHADQGVYFRYDYRASTGLLNWYIQNSSTFNLSVSKILLRYSVAGSTLSTVSIPTPSAPPSFPVSPT